GHSGQQWDSWNAIFGQARNGEPTPLFDWKTGRIDHSVAEQWARYDIGRLLASAPEKYGPIFRDRIRILVGTEDNYYLDGAVRLLRDRLEESGYLSSEDDDAFGSIRILEGEDHFTLQDWKWRGEIGQEIYDYIEDAGVQDRKRGGDDDEDSEN
ncbi:MAG: hypothetical protein KDA21_11215, partial [Phycisphaerales bacterium]|nr:hypothetical protein [Phycisphaerales bacterium]